MKIKTGMHACMTEKVTVVMPVHNEEEFLRSSLRSIWRLKPSELILIFDRCTDKSLAVAKEFVSRHELEDKTTFVEVTEQNEWKSRFSFLRCLGIDMAANDIVLKTGADVILDACIVNHVSRIHQFPFISFNYLEIPLNFQNLMQRLFSHLPAPFKSDKLAGIYLVNRKVMYECADREELKQLDAGEDTFLHYSIKRHYPTDYVITKTVHLRPRRSSGRHYMKGRIYWSSGHRGFVKMALVAVLTARFSTIKGYIHERFGTAQ
jgi:glycosyltransferase involved in cell wall biosynthesis